jgi:hypothetical protein
MEAFARFGEALAEQANASRVTVLSKGFLFWRAQLAHDTELQPIRDGEEIVDEIQIEVPCGPERMKPRKGLVREGAPIQREFQGYASAEAFSEVAQSEGIDCVRKFDAVPDEKQRHCALDMISSALYQRTNW